MKKSGVKKGRGTHSCHVRQNNELLLRFLSFALRLGGVTLGIRLLAVAGFLTGSAHHELAPHKRLTVQHLSGALGILELTHLHKGITLALVGAGVIDDFDTAYIAEALEEVFQLSLGSLVGEITDVETSVPGGRHGCSAATPTGSRVATVIVGSGVAPLGDANILLGLIAVLLISALSSGLLLLTEAEKAQDTLQESGFLSGFIVRTRHTIAIRTSIIAAAAGTLPLPSLRMMFCHV